MFCEAILLANHYLSFAFTFVNVDFQFTSEKYSGEEMKAAGDTEEDANRSGAVIMSWQTFTSSSNLTRAILLPAPSPCGSSSSENYLPQTIWKWFCRKFDIIAADRR